MPDKTNLSSCANGPLLQEKNFSSTITMPALNITKKAAIASYSRRPFALLFGVPVLFFLLFHVVPNLPDIQSVKLTGSTPNFVANIWNSARERSLCPHSIILSSQRHGSTWVVNCLDNCTYSNPETSHFIKKVFVSSELWIWPTGPLATIAPESAVEYVKKNGTIKVFQQSLENRTEQVTELLRHARIRNVPVFFLRRNLRDAYASKLVAKKNWDWRHSVKDQGDGDRSSQQFVNTDNNYVRYRGQMKLYFEKLARIAGDVPTIWYEDIVHKEWFFVPKVLNGQGCWIRDCSKRLTNP